MDKNSDRIISDKEFAHGLKKVYLSDLDTKIKLTFDM